MLTGGLLLNVYQSENEKKLIYRQAFDTGYVAGKAEKTALKLDEDKICTAWFFNTNFKEAKRRMCK